VPHLDSLATLSGLLTFFGTAALLYKRFTPAAILFVIDGSAGTGIFWDRWSRETGHHVQVSALFSGVAPRTADLELLATHLPLLVIGLVILAAVAWRNGGEHGFRRET
jgi:hypothetical protein